MPTRALLIVCLALGMVAGVLGLASTTAGADCATSECRADVGIFGSAIPSPVNPTASASSLIYITAKNNGPNNAYGIDVHITVPYQLKILYARDYAAAQQCTTKGTFIDCYMGNFRREQLATVVIKVHPRGRKGTYEIPAEVYSQGVVDINPGNNQITATLGVYAKGHGG